MRRHLPSLLLSILLVPVLSAVSFAQTADEIIEKHLAALGGRQALAKLTSRRSTGTVTITTPNGNLSGPIEIDTKAPNKTRSYLELDLSAVGANQTMTIEQKFDGTAGIALNSLQGNTEMTAGQLANLRNNTFPSALVDYKTAGASLVLQPKETLAGKPAFVILFTPKTGPAVRMFFDAETYLLVRTMVTVEMPQTGQLEQVTEPSDYRVVDGVKVPFHIVNSNQVQTVTIDIKKVEHNVALADTLFSVK